MAAVALAAALAGCGGPGELETFRTERLRPVQARVEEDRAVVARIVESVQLGNERDARQLGQAVDRLAARADEVRGLRPPTEAAPEVEGYAAAIEELARQLRAYADAVAASDVDGAARASARSRAAVDRLVRRRQELDRAVRTDG